MCVLVLEGRNGEDPSQTQWVKKPRGGWQVCPFYCTCHGPVRTSPWVPRWVLPNSFHFWVLGAGTPAPHLCPRCRGHAKRTWVVLPNHPQRRPAISTRGTVRTVVGTGEGSDWARSIAVNVADSRKPLYCWRQAPQRRTSRFRQLPSGYIRFGSSPRARCALMLKKSLLENFKATIKYSIVMAQLNGLAWENWGL